MLKSRSIVIGLLSGLTLMGSSTIANFDSRTVAQQPSQIQGTQNYPKATGKVSSGDRTFLTRSAQDSLLEVATSQLAIQRATNPQIVQYSLRIMSDHTQYNQRLMLLSREKGLSLPLS